MDERIQLKSGKKCSPSSKKGKREHLDSFSSTSSSNLWEQCVCGNNLECKITSSTFCVRGYSENVKSTGSIVYGEYIWSVHVWNLYTCECMKGKLRYDIMYMRIQYEKTPVLNKENCTHVIEWFPNWVSGSLLFVDHAVQAGTAKHLVLLYLTCAAF